MSFTSSLADIVSDNSSGLLSIHDTWGRVNLSDVAMIQNGFPFNSDGFSVDSGFPVIRIRDILKGVTATYFNGEYDDSYVVRSGELLVGMDGDFNSSVWSGQDALLNQRVCRVSPQAQYYDKRLLAYALPGYLKAINERTSSITVKHLSSKTVGEIPLPLPPRSEQERLASKLDELFSDLDAGVAALERAKAKLKRYRASVLKATVEGRLTAEWRKANPPKETGEQLLARILAERKSKWEEAQLAKFKAKGQKPPKNWREKYVEPVRPDVSGLPELPEGWCWATMGQCFTVSVGATPSRKEPSYWNGSIPWVSSGEVQFGRIKHTREHITESGLKNSSTRVNPSGSVILGMIGEGKTRGQAAILDVEACNNQNCAAIWVSQAGIKPEFIYYWLFGQYDKTRSLGSGNNQPALNKSIVERMVFPLPPLDEMSDIVEQLELAFSVAAEAEVSVSNSLSRASRLRQSILKRAFEGKLIPQDPNDEPASVLLERIKAERAKSAADPSRRGLTPKATPVEASTSTAATAPKRRGRPPKRKDS